MQFLDLLTTELALQIHEIFPHLFVELYPAEIEMELGKCSSGQFPWEHLVRNLSTGMDSSLYNERGKNIKLKCRGQFS